MKFDYNRLKAERVAKGFTVEEMAKALGVAKSTYSKKENGKLSVSVDDFSIISGKLEITKEKICIFFTHDVSESETNLASWINW